MMRHAPTATIALLGLCTTTAAFAQVTAPPSAAVEDAAPAKQGPDLVVTGSFFTRYELRQNYDDLGLAGGRIGELDAFAYRARLGLTTTPIDVGKGRWVVLSMTPQASGFWGVTSGGLVDAGLGLHAGSLVIKGAANWFEAGRFEMAYGDHLVIGNVGFHETGRSFDGMRTRIGLGVKGAWIDGFLTQVAEGAPVGPAFGAGDGVFVGSYAALGPLIAVGMDLDAYVLGLVFPETDDGDPTTDEFGAVEVTVGSRVVQPLGDVKLHAEAGVQLGKRPTADERVFAFQVDAGAWFNAGTAAKIGAEGFYASGDDPTTDTVESWNQLFPTAHKFLGFMDIMGGRSNVLGGTAKFRFTASPDLTLAADAHVFLRPQTADGVDSYTGLEGELWGVYALGKGLDLRGQYAAFVPNESGPFGTDSLAHYVEVQLTYTLK